MYIVQNQQRESVSLPGIEHVTLAGSSEGLVGISVWQQSLEPGAATPPHRHDCEEVAIVNAGNGELHIDGKVLPFSANSTLVIPGNVLHQIFNTGETAMKLIAVFSVSPVEAYFPDGERIPLPWRT